MTVTPRGGEAILFGTLFAPLGSWSIIRLSFMEEGHKDGEEKTIK